MGIGHINTFIPNLFLISGKMHLLQALILLFDEYILKPFNIVTNKLHKVLDAMAINFHFWINVSIC